MSPKKKHNRFSGYAGILTQNDYCEGKRKYDKKSAITARNQRYKEDHTELRIYPCPDCHYWHLTSINPHGGDRDYKEMKRRKFERKVQKTRSDIFDE